MPLPWTCTSLVSRSTFTAVTPATLVTSSVTATWQCEQVMPVTRYVWGRVDMWFLRGERYGEGVSGRPQGSIPPGGTQVTHAARRPAGAAGTRSFARRIGGMRTILP